MGAGMASKRIVTLAEVQETLLIPLYARALETRKAQPLIVDPQSVAVVEQLDYDFARLGTGPSMLGSVIRGMIFDNWVSEFLRRHPGGTVVEIGAGLNTRYERLDNGRARWLEFDLPDVMGLRREFFSDTERRRLLTASVLDEHWIAAAREHPGPHLFISEAVLIYLPVDQVRAVLGRIQREFAEAELIMDVFLSAFLPSLERHDTLQHMAARPQWGVDDPAVDLPNWGVGLSLLASCTPTAPPPAVRERLSESVRDQIDRVEARPEARQYRLNWLRITPT